MSLAGRAATIACASSRGLRFAAFASCSAALVAKSPCAESRVRSITGATRRVNVMKLGGQGGERVLHQPLNQVFQGLAVGGAARGASLREADGLGEPEM